MRLMILALALIASGCSTAPKTRAVPPAAQQHRTPVALGRPMVSARIQGQRLQDAQVAQGPVTVEGQRVR